jgi:hypothetical protein
MIILRRITIWFVLGVSVVSLGCGREAGALDPSAPENAPVVEEARRVADEIDQGDYGEVRKRFDTLMRGSVSEDQLARGWEEFERLKGAMRSQGRVELFKRGEYTVVNVELDMQEQDAQLRVTFDDDRKIHGLFLFDAGEPVPE